MSANESGEPQAKKVCKSIMEGALVCIGNPLLDISAVGTKEFLDKYDLKANDQILAEDKHIPMFKEMVDTMNVEYIAGGATQNTVRMVQWLLGQPRVGCFFGCIGDDEFGKILSGKMQEAGANARYLINKEQATGTCAVVLTDNKRSLVANLAAANHYKIDHLLEKEQWELATNAKIIYSAGFHLTVAPDALVRLGKLAAEENKIFATNLSAPFISQFFKDQLSSLLPYIDYLFGNETEAAAFSKSFNFETEDIKEIALKASQLEKKNSKRSRMVIITQGDKPTVVAKDGEVKEFPVIPIKSEAIVDTNGAGDCFVGGFLSQLLQDKSLDDCIAAGNYAANYIIQQSGITMNDKPNLPTRN